MECIMIELGADICSSVESSSNAETPIIDIIGGEDLDDDL